MFFFEIKNIKNSTKSPLNLRYRQAFNYGEASLKRLHENTKHTKLTERRMPEALFDIVGIIMTIC